MVDLETFREDTGRWLSAHAPPSMSTPPQGEADMCWGGRKTKYPDDVKRWLEVMAERGWTAPTWPTPYGGGGLSEQEGKGLPRGKAELHPRPPLIGFGLTLIGPLLLPERDQEQKKEHPPRIRSG